MCIHSGKPVQAANRRELRKHARSRRERILAALALGDATLEGIVRLVGEPEHRVRYALTVLETLSAVHICGWELVAAMKYELRVPRYRLGPGANVPPPLARWGAIKRFEQSALDRNPGAALQAVTLKWGRKTMKEKQHAQE